MTNTTDNREKAVRYFSEKFRDANTGALREALVECAMQGYDFAISQIPWEQDQ